MNARLWGKLLVVFWSSDEAFQQRALSHSSPHEISRKMKDGRDGVAKVRALQIMRIKHRSSLRKLFWSYGGRVNAAHLSKWEQSWICHSTNSTWNHSISPYVSTDSKVYFTVWLTAVRTLIVVQLWTVHTDIHLTVMVGTTIWSTFQTSLYIPNSKHEETRTP